MEINNIVYGLAGLTIGGLCTSLWLGGKIKELKNTILDKRTIVMLLKDAIKDIKPKNSYKRKPVKKKYNGTATTTSNVTKKVVRKKYEKAS